MSFTARAAWLCYTSQARDFSEACSMLAKLRRRQVRSTPVKVAVAEKRYWWSEE